MKSIKRTSLFDSLSSPDDKQDDKKPEKKRGRPKKNPEPVKTQQTVVKPEKSKKESAKKEKKEIIVKQPKSPEPVKKKTTKKLKDDWKSFDESKPEKLVPCEFYVDTGSEKQDIFYGYISEENLTCTNEPYKLIVIRKKYGNLYYREIKGCSSIHECKDYFPDCKHCKKGRDRK